MHILIEPITLAALVIGLFNGIIAIYLLARPRKTWAGWLLALLFGVWALSAFHTALQTSLVWDRTFGLFPLKYPWLLLVYAVHLHFAYAFLGNPYRREARFVVPLGYGLALLLSAHPTWAGVTGLVTGLTPPPFGEGITSSEFLIRSGIVLLLSWSLIVYARKSIRSTREATGGAVGWARALQHPVGREARAHVAFLVPWAIVFLSLCFEFALQLGGMSTNAVVMSWLFFSLLHQGAFVLVYLTFSPEPTSIRAKLSGAALVVTLALLTALILALSQHDDYVPDRVRLPEGQTLQFTPRPEAGYRVERLPLAPSQTFDAEASTGAAEEATGERLGERIGTWHQAWTPVATGFAFPMGGAAYDTLYVSTAPFIALDTPPPPRDGLSFQFFAGSGPKLAPLLLVTQPPREQTSSFGAVYVRREPERLTVTWHNLQCCTTPSDRVTVQLTLHTDGAFSFSYPMLADISAAVRVMPLIGIHPGGKAHLETFEAAQDTALAVPAGAGLVDNIGVRHRAYAHDRLVPFVWIVLISSFVVLIGFPLLLRSSLTAPIERLLGGVRRVSEGERDVTVPIGAEDEVGRLTSYFNRMTASLREAEADLRAHAETLEHRVEERTAELQAQKEKSEAQAEVLAAQAEELTAQAEQLRELDALKSRFFANISHELRTPLTLLLGPVRDALDPENEHALERLRQHLPLMERNGERLLALIGQLLDLARLEGGGMHLHAREIDLVVFVGALTEGFAARAEALGLSLVFDAGARSLLVWADADKLEKVVVNLVSNALKFTPGGGKVRVRVGVRRGPEGTHAEFSIQDTGPGIPSDQLQHVFDRFHQVDGSATRSHEGAGIGLALARELVELHRGTLSVESTEGFGSTFAVRLPLGRSHLGPDEILDEDTDTPTRSVRPQQFVNTDIEDAALDEDAISDEDPISEGVLEKGGMESGIAEVGGLELAETSSEEALLDRHVVLMVEDHTDMRTYLRSLLEPTYRVVEAADGAEGVALARLLYAEGSGGPHLVVSDVMMPGTDGFTLCRTLKSDPDLEHVPVVLLTARADDTSRLEGLSEGADAYLAKPFSAEELLTRAENLIALRQRLRERFGGRVVVGATEVEVPSAEAAWVAEARNIVEAHIGDTTFGVERLADKLAVSTRQLQRRMKEAAGLTPHGFMRMIRLERAAQLLEQQAGGVAEVAYAVGYQTPDYFSRQFREVFGVLPSAYREVKKAQSK